MFEAAVNGYLVALSLILAIGAQNAFVLRQGLRKEHVGAVVAACALSDAVLISAGVLGTLNLLLRLRNETQSLPNLSARLGMM